MHGVREKRQYLKRNAHFAIKVDEILRPLPGQTGTLSS